MTTPSLTPFAFISRHRPSSEQHQLAEDQDIELTYVGDTDAFTVSPSFVFAACEEHNRTFEGVVVVHPAAALRLAGDFLVGVFENENRAPVGEKQQFMAKALHIYDLRD